MQYFWGNNNQKNNNNNSDYYDNRGGRSSQQRGQRQAQKQKYAKTTSQKEMVVKIRAFQGQINSVYKTLLNVLNMVENSQRFDEDTVDMMTDMLICSLNMFASNCHEFHQNNNRDALDLGKKMVYDTFEKLKNENYVIYEKTECYREFLMAALKSNKLLKFNANRVLTNNQQKLEDEASINPEAVNGAFAKLIGNHNINERKINSYREDKTNKKLKFDQEAELREFRKNDAKYNQLDEEYSGNISNMNQLYFTKSGKNAQFVDNEAMDDMMADILGDEKEENQGEWINAVINLSERNPICLNNNNNGNNIRICQPYPCQILVGGDQPGGRTQHKISLKLANPYKTDRDLFIDPNQFEIIQNNKNNRNYIAQIEQIHCNKYQTDLGYHPLFEYAPDLDVDRNTDKNNDIDIDLDSLEIRCQNQNDREQEIINYDNAVIKFSKRKSHKNIKKPYPCLIIDRDTKHKKLTVKLAKPYDSAIIKTKVKRIECEIEYVKQKEAEHINNYGELGYKSIQQLQHEKNNTTIINLDSSDDSDDDDEGDDDTGMKF